MISLSASCGFMHFFYSFLLCILNAFLCAHFAKRRGRNSLYWFISGACFGLFALATLFLLPSRKKNFTTTVKPKSVLPLLQAMEQSQTSKLWYYLDLEGKQCGPISFDGLTHAWNSGKVHVQSFVWNEELENWKRLEEVVHTSQQTV